MPESNEMLSSSPLAQGTSINVPTEFWVLKIDLNIILTICNWNEFPHLRMDLIKLIPMNVLWLFF